MSHFAYPCPDCRSTTDLHDPDCNFGGRSRSEIERAYADVLAVLSTGPRPAAQLRRSAPGEWTPLHDGALDRLRRGCDAPDRASGRAITTPDGATREQVASRRQRVRRTVVEVAHDGIEVVGTPRRGFDDPDGRTGRHVARRTDGGVGREAL